MDSCPSEGILTRNWHAHAITLMNKTILIIIIFLLVQFMSEWDILIIFFMWGEVGGKEAILFEGGSVAAIFEVIVLIIK